MPTYDYRCNGCGHEFEQFQRMSDPVRRRCPKCGKKRLERLIGTGAGLIFKGSGFYITDYKRNDKKEAKDDAKKDAAPGSGDRAADSKGKSAPGSGSKQNEKPPD